jgi:signal transduction histidine kinase
VNADGPSLTQALANLVSNGIRFTPDGGRVEVRAYREDPWLVITVRDTGVGIEPGNLSKIFERAFVVRDSLNHHSSSTLEFNSAGLGLGLSIARGIVEAHEGWLTVESEPGQGSTFMHRVPLGGVAELEHAA